MEFLGSTHPVVPVDPVRERPSQCGGDEFDIIGGEVGDLPECEDVHAVEHLLQHRPDSVDLLEVVWFGAFRRPEPLGDVCDGSQADLLEAGGDLLW